jgi:hypothetical protein
MYNYPGGHGGYDLYISYKRNIDSWTKPRNLGSQINTGIFDMAAYVTSDKKYMFFTRRGDKTNSDIYWVSADFIDSLKHTNFAPYLKNNIPKQTDTVGNLFTYSIPDTTFIDDDGNNTLTYSAKLTNGDLPLWLHFDPATRTFTSTQPLPEAKTYTIQVTATDTAKEAVSTSFTLKVVDKPTSINQSFKESIQVFPNPTKAKLTISLGNTLYKSAMFKVTGIDGKLILSNTYQNLASISIDLSGKPKGMYVVSIVVDGKVVNRNVCLE